MLSTGEIVPLAPILQLGDFNQDGHVNVSDVSAAMAALSNLKDYQTGLGVSGSQFLQIGDVNGDSKVNNADVQALISLIANTNNGAGSLTAVPEPTTFVLGGVGVVVLVLTRRRLVGPTANR